jgi:hypothetical protein
MIGFNLLEMSLVIILKMTLHKDIGRYLSAVFYSFYLWINAINMALSACRMEPKVKDSSRTSYFSWMIIPQHVWNKFEVNPSCPRAFHVGISFTFLSTSSKVIGHNRLLFL